MQGAFGYIEKNRTKLIDITRKLVSIPTVNPPGENYENIVGVLERYCRNLGLMTRRIVVPNKELKKFNIKGGSKRINLIADWPIGRRRTLHICNHYDVVPATGSWKANPFKPVIKKGKIYGRGAEDMKANIACALIAVESLKVNNIKPHCNIELSFSPDEETGGKSGFDYLVRKGLIKPDYAISEGYHGNTVSYGNKGLLWLKIEVLGKASHASEPHKGINSFEKMVMLANELLKLKKKISRKTTRFNTKHAIDKHPTMVMGGELYGGNKINIVPDKSVFTIDRRILPEEDIKDVKKEISDVVKRLKQKEKGLKVKIGIISKEKAAVYDKKSKLYDSFSQSILKVLGKKGRRALLTGATDLRFLIRKGIPCAGYSVDGGNTCHCDNEYVKIKSLVDTAKIYADVMANLT